MAFLDTGYLLLNTIVITCTLIFAFICLLYSFTLFFEALFTFLVDNRLIKKPFDSNSEMERREFIFALPIVITSVVILGLIITTFGLAGGYLLSGGVIIDLPIKFYLSNILFDFFTVTFTIFIISSINLKTNLLDIILLTLVDLIAATIFAFLAVKIGLSGTIHELDSIQILNSLFFVFDQDYTRIEGYIVTLMHTTFIPTILYMGLFVLLILSKTMMTIIEDTIIPRSNLSKPYMLTRTFFLVLAATTFFIKEVYKLIYY